LEAQALPAILAIFLVSGTALVAQDAKPTQNNGRDLRKLTENTVYRDRIQPHWLSDNTRLWYKVKTGADTQEFILVDAVKGERKRAFDHDRLAKALSDAGVKDASPDRLPIDKLEFKEGENTVVFRAGGKSWSCRLDSGAIAEQSDGKEESSSLPPAQATASLNTGGETTLTFINRTQGDVELFWLNAEGERQGYGKLKAGEQRDQHTYAGHAWLAADSSGKTLAVYVAEEQPARAEIGLQSTGAKPVAKEPRRKRSGREDMPPRDTSPDGHWRAYIKDHNVVAKNLESGETISLSSDGNADDAYTERMHWSPDSTKLVVIRTKNGEDRKVTIVESSPKNQLQPKLHSFDYAKPGDRLPIDKPQLFDVPGERQIPVGDELFPNPWSLSDLRWEPDSSRFTFLYNQRGHQVLRIVAVDAKSGVARPIVDEQSQTFVCYSGKYFAESMDETGEIIWMSERDGWNQLYLYDSHSGKVKNRITQGSWVVRGVEKVDRENRQIWFTASGIRPEQDPYYIHFCRVNFDGTGMTLLTEGDGTHIIQYSPDRKFFIDTYSRVDLPPVNELRRTEDGKLVCELERADWTALLKTGWRAPERFVAKGRDGETDIYGIITRPIDFDPSRKYPILEDIYAGPQDSFVAKSFNVPGRHQELAELGFVVVQMDGMGTSNRSKKFHDICWKNLGDAGFPDRILWIRAAAAKYPHMDLSRVGIFGTSAGGQSALGGLLLHPEFYKAGVSDCGCHDNRMDKIWWNEQWMGWPVGAHYAEQSNVTLAPRLQGKLLLMVGEMDKNVDPASTMQVVNALIKAGKDFEFLVVPGAGHGVAGTPYGRHRLREFFTRHFLGH
jgi:dipeptidyl aminopeptidase/acylaminoacyl peptidase